MENKPLMTAMDLIAGSWQLYKNNFDRFVQPIIITALISIAALIIDFFDFPFNGIFTILILLASIIISFWISVVFIRIADQIQEKKTTPLANVYQESFRRTPKFFWVSFLYGLIILGGMILFVVPGIIFAVWFALAPVIVALSEKQQRVGEVFKGSKQLIEGRWWASLWRLIAPQVFFSLIVFIIAYGLIGILTGGQFQMAELSQNFYFNVLLVLLSAIINPLMILPLVLFYRNLEKTR